MKTEDNIKAEDKAHLLELLSPYLPGKHPPQLLNFLVEEEAQGAPAKSEPEIAARLFKTEAEAARADHKTGSSSRPVSKAAAVLRNAIKIFSFSPEARKLPIEIQFPQREFKIQFVKRAVSVMKFWKPYLETANKQDLLIVYPENVFFRHLQDRHFIRHLDVNFTQPEHLALSTIKGKVQLSSGQDDLQPSRQFVSSGDVAAALYLSTWFERLGVHVTHTVAHHLTHITGYGKKNLIVLGNLRTYPPETLEHLMNDFNFGVGHDGVTNKNPIDGDPETKDEDSAKTPLYRDNFKAPGHAQGVLVRAENEDLGSLITIISSNNGRFHENVAHSLISEKPCSQLLHWLGTTDGEFPRQFEAYLHTELPRDENTSRPTNRLQHKAKRIYEK